MLQDLRTKLNSVLRNKEYKRVGENIIALSLLNGIYFLSPLILIPFLMHTIGSELYGIYIFSWTFIYYYIFIVNYGFEYTTTRDIAINRKDLKKVSEIFSITFYTRLLLVCVSFIILGFCLLFIHKFQQNAQIILLGLGVIIGQALFPTWLYQGMEEMKFITIVNSITRLLPLVLVFIFVKTGKDIGLIILFQSVGYLSGGLFSHFFAIKHYKLKLTIPVFSKIKENLISGWSMFVSTVGISFYRETNTILLGFLTNNFELVGFYALSDKIVRLFQIIANTFTQALFPFFGSRLIERKEDTLIKYKKVGFYYSIFLLLCTIILFLFIPLISKLYLGKEFPSIIRDVRILSPIILFGGLNYYFGIAGLVNFNHKKVFTVFVLFAGIINIILCLILGRFYADAGAAFSLLIAEFLLLCLILFYLNKKENIFHISF